MAVAVLFGPNTFKQKNGKRIAILMLDIRNHNRLSIDIDQWLTARPLCLYHNNRAIVELKPPHALLCTPPRFLLQ